MQTIQHDKEDSRIAVAAFPSQADRRRTGQDLCTIHRGRFSDGRQVKSTSIGIKDSDGRYIAALCLNVDLTLFQGFQSALNQFTAIEGNAPARENLDPAGADAIRARIDEFAAKLASTPRALRAEERRTLMKELKAAGLLEVRRAMDTIASHLGVSRATVYSDAK
jgi:predicted transcriptional regulator YheO